MTSELSRQRLQNHRSVEQPVRIAHQLSKGLFDGGKHMLGVDEALADQPFSKLLILSSDAAFLGTPSYQLRRLIL